MGAVRVMTRQAYLMSLAAVVHDCSANFTFSQRLAEVPLAMSSRSVVISIDIFTACCLFVVILLQWKKRSLTLKLEQFSLPKILQKCGIMLNNDVKRKYNVCCKELLNWMVLWSVNCNVSCRTMWKHAHIGHYVAVAAAAVVIVLVNKVVIVVIFIIVVIVIIIDKNLIKRWETQTWHRSILLPVLRLTSQWRGSPETISIKSCIEVKWWLRYKTTKKYCGKFQPPE